MESNFLYNYYELFDKVKTIVSTSNKININSNFVLRKYDITYIIISVIYYNTMEAELIYNNLKKLINKNNFNFYFIDKFDINNKFSSITIYIDKKMLKNEKI